MSGMTQSRNYLRKNARCRRQVFGDVMAVEPAAGDVTSTPNATARTYAGLSDQSAQLSKPVPDWPHWEPGPGISTECVSRLDKRHPLGVFHCDLVPCIRGKRLRCSRVVAQMKPRPCPLNDARVYSDALPSVIPKFKCQSPS